MYYIYIYICRFAPLKKFQNGVPNPYTARHWHQNQVKRFPCHRSLILHIVRSFSRSIESMSLIWFSKSHRMKSTSFKCHICGLKNLTIFSLFFLHSREIALSVRQWKECVNSPYKNSPHQNNMPQFCMNGMTKTEMKFIHLTLFSE